MKRDASLKRDASPSAVSCCGVGEANRRDAIEPARCAEIVPLLPYQREDVESESRFRWNCWSRQTGKSFTKSLRRILRGLARGRTQIFLSAGERQSRELMAKARRHCQALKIATDYYDNRFFKGLSIKQLEIVLPGNVRIIGLPANPETARGYTGDVFLDEFAMHREDREIWGAILPSLLRGDGELDVASTPKGRSNMFFQLSHNDRFSKSIVTLPEAIAQGLDVDAAEMRRAMNDDTLYRQEFLCQFLDETTAFLTYERIACCADPALVLYDTPAELSRDTRELFVGVDIGRYRDLTVAWVLAREGDALVTVGLFELAAAPFREQAVEEFGGHRVEAVQLTLALKSQMASALRILVEAQRIRIPDDARIRDDWHSVERSVTSSGHFKLSAPRREGSHADRFWAAALAVHAADTARGPAEHMTTSPLQFARAGTW
ncbi:MAG: hypothetical protein IID36_01260 [Planctomycetes bacterium]|nr:hypothetical protein [Planctomycetota bacterium]